MRTENTFEGLLVGDRNISVHLYTLLFFCLSLMITGYRVYLSNHALQLPLVDLLKNPNLYPNDPFAAALPYYASMLWRAVALGNRIIPLEPLLLTLFLIERYLVIYAAGHLARVFAPRSLLAIFGAMAFFSLAPQPIIGGGTIVTSYFEQTGLSIPFFLLAMSAFYRHQPIAWAVWLSVGFNLNSMYGTYALTYFGAAFVLDSTYWKAWKMWFLSIALFLVLASPVIVLTFMAYSRKAADSNLWIIASRVRLSEHLYPTAWSTWRLAKFVTVTALFIVLIFHYKGKLEKLFKHGIAWTGVSMVWVIYAFVAAYMESPSMLVMQPARGVDLWHCFAGIGAISILAVALEEEDVSQFLLPVAFLASVLVLRTFKSFILVPLLAFLVFFFITWVSKKRPVRIETLLASLRGNSGHLGVFLSLIVLIFGIRAFQVRIAKVPTVRGALFARPDPLVEQVATWANANTPVDAMFLINPTWETFRALSKRPVFVTIKDGSAILWDRTYVTDWVERLRALGFDININRRAMNKQVFNEELNRLYLKLRDPHVRILKKRFPIRYWVVSVKRPSAFPTVFQNQQYKVLDLQ